jgi:lipoate-protein ligase A
VGVTSIARELGATPTAADVEEAMLRAFGVRATDSSALSPAERLATERLLADRYEVPAWHADAEAGTGVG